MISLKLMREFETGRAVADDYGDRATTPTGEPYVVLTGLGGADYAKDKAGRLYWRSLPELDHGPDGARFYARLFIAKEADAAS